MKTDISDTDIKRTTMLCLSALVIAELTGAYLWGTRFRDTFSHSEFIDNLPIITHILAFNTYWFLIIAGAILAWTVYIMRTGFNKRHMQSFVIVTSLSVIVIQAFVLIASLLPMSGTLIGEVGKTDAQPSAPPYGAPRAAGER